MSKIKATDTVQDVVVKMAEGNPGAINVLMQLLRGSISDSGVVFAFDSIGLYGSKLYMLWNDSCGRDMVKVKDIVRAWQSGDITSERILEAVSGGWGEPYSDILVDYLQEHEEKEKAFIKRITEPATISGSFTIPNISGESINALNDLCKIDIVDGSIIRSIIYSGNDRLYAEKLIYQLIVGDPIEIDDQTDVIPKDATYTIKSIESTYVLERDEYVIALDVLVHIPEEG